MNEYIDKESFKSKYLCCGYLPEMSEEEFDAFPAADVERVRHGWWMGKPPKSTCSVCGKYAKWDSEPGGWWSEVRTPYCPHCGAKMR